MRNTLATNVVENHTTVQTKSVHFCDIVSNFHDTLNFETLVMAELCVTDDNLDSHIKFANTEELASNTKEIPRPE